MNPEVEEAIRIADKHLAGESGGRREDLAKDIVLAIINHARRVCDDVLVDVLAKSKH